MEIFDPLNGNWSAGLALPSEVNHGTAITVSDKIYLSRWSKCSEQELIKF